MAEHDPHAPTPTQSLEDAVLGADVVMVATNHSEFERPEMRRAILDSARGECLIVDPWNSFGSAQVFAFNQELAALHP